MQQFLTGHEVELLIKLGLSLFAGLVIGLERESRGKIAGISTQTLVVSGSMLFTFLSLQFSTVDPARIAAGVVTGIGFLGGGIIFKGEGGVLANVTTAASIWFSASIGMTIGFGWYFIAVIATVFAALVLHVPKLGGRRVKPDA